jgi:hypothetical protein
MPVATELMPVVCQLVQLVTRSHRKAKQECAGRLTRKTMLLCATSPVQHPLAVVAVPERRIRHCSMPLPHPVPGEYTPAPGIPVSS